ncbi:MAG: enoyl-CoA hydratase/isomerase family protein [Deltaproteobacteria bacterium]|nr:enoyl-CoA hydratase/isomerase family protein [Deltaproteobacteria bacterium]
MSARLVEYSVEGSVSIMIISNPPMNPMTKDVWEQFDQTLDELDSRKDEIRVLVITGKGKAFVAGADIKSFPQLTQEAARSRLKIAKPRYIKLEQFERPVICAINGYCLGAGLELAMCCDIRIASSKAQLGQPEINVGLIPGGGGTQRLPRLVGPGIAKEMIFTGNFISAEKALSIGLVNRVVEPEELMKEAMEMANLIAGKPPIAVRAAKEAINRGLNISLAEGLEVEASQWSYLCGTEDQKEGAKAFIEKRKPVFIGR